MLCNRDCRGILGTSAASVRRARPCGRSSHQVQQVHTIMLRYYTPTKGLAECTYKMRKRNAQLLRRARTKRCQANPVSLRNLQRSAGTQAPGAVHCKSLSIREDTRTNRAVIFGKRPPDFRWEGQPCLSKVDGAGRG